MIEKINKPFTTISDLATVPKKHPSELKADFDKDVNTLREKVNEVIDVTNDGATMAEDSKKLGGKLPSYYAKQSDIPDISNLATKSEIPDISNLASKQEVSLKADKSEIPNLTPYALKTEIPDISGKADKSEIPDISGKADKSEIPSIPSNVSAFTNDAGYLTQHQSLSEYAKKSEIPSTSTFATKTELNAKADKTEIPTIPSNVSAFTNDAGYLTQHQSLSNYVQTTDSRLSDARTPKQHTHSATEVTYGESLGFTVKNNVYIDSKGVETPYSGWDATDFIDIGNATKIFANTNNQWNAWYKADQTFLSVANFTSKTYLDVPANAKYIRLSGTASAIASLSVSTSSDTVASVLEGKADKSDIPVVPDVSNMGKAKQLLYFGTCDTAQATVAKTTAISNFPTGTIPNGTILHMWFTYASATNSTLSINGGTAYPIRRYGTTAISTSSNGWNAKSIVLLTFYDGAWYHNYWTNSTYSNYSFGIGYGTCATAYATVAKTVIHSNYVLTNGGINAVKFTYDVCANATINVNSKGAKSIYYKGAKITDKVIKAGDIALFVYDNTNYNLITCDSWQGGGADVEALTTTEVNTLWSEA